MQYRCCKIEPAHRHPTISPLYTAHATPQPVWLMPCACCRAEGGAAGASARRTTHRKDALPQEVQRDQTLQRQAKPTAEHLRAVNTTYGATVLQGEPNDTTRAASEGARLEASKALQLVAGNGTELLAGTEGVEEQLGNQTQQAVPSVPGDAAVQGTLQNASSRDVQPRGSALEQGGGLAGNGTQMQQSTNGAADVWEAVTQKRRHIRRRR